MHAGRSTTVYIPWREFVAVKRARVDPAAPKLDPSSVRQLGLVLSRFEFNGLANPNYWAGKFSLKVHYCVQTDPRMLQKSQQNLMFVVSRLLGLC